MLPYLKQRAAAFVATNQFSPSFAGVLVSPFWLTRRELSRFLSRHTSQLQGNVLDFGCGTAPYRALLTAANHYIGLEYDTPENRNSKKADIFYDGVTIPLPDASVNAILSTQTLEHIPNPKDIIAEWARVLKPDGLLLCTVPFMWPEHEMPYDFHRYSTNGIRQIIESCGFQIISQERLLCDCRTPAQLFLAWLYDSLKFESRSSVVKIFLMLILFSPVSLLATILAHISPKNSNTYCDNGILAKRVKS